MSFIKNKLHNIVADVREAKAAVQSHNVGSYEAPPASNMHNEQHLPPPPPRSLPHGWTARFDEKEGKFAYCMGVDGVEQWEFRMYRIKSTETYPGGEILTGRGWM